VKRSLIFQIIAVLVLISIFLIAGCEQTPVQEKRNYYVGGSQGIQLDFVSGAPPEYIFDDGQSPFAIGVKLENKGEDVIEQDEMKLTIQGLDPNKFGVSSSDLKDATIAEPELLGVSKTVTGDILKGGETEIYFSDLNYLENEPGSFTRLIRASLCYNYQTESIVELCIKSRLYEEEEAICSISGPKDSYNSGAPVQITSVTENPLGEGKVQFSFKIDHVGQGKIFSINDDVCDDVKTNIERNKIYIEVGKINGRFPACTGLEGSSTGHSGFVRVGGLTSAEPATRTISCTLDVSDVDGVFVDNLDILLDYNYLNYIEKEIEVRDVSIGSN